MTYNLHPIFVHFPIAFLLLYSLLLILPIEKWFPKVSWKPLRIVLIIAGLAGALLATSTGEVAADITRPDRDILDMHEWFAGASNFVYSVLLASEIWSWLETTVKRLKVEILSKLIKFIGNLITHKLTTVLLSILGLVCISITGMLGGIMVYGVSADPLAGPLLKLLGL